MRHLIFTASAQALQSGVSFLATLVFVNALIPSEFGAYAAILSIWMIFLSAHRAVLGEQLVAGKSGHEGYFDFVVCWGLIGTAVTLAIAFLVAGPGLLFAAAYCALFTFSDALRYEVFARAHSRHDLLGLNAVDIARVTLVGAGLFSVIVLSQPVVAEWLALVSAAIWPIFVSISRRQFRPKRALLFARSLGGFEGAMSAQFILGTGASQAIPFIALGVFGSTAFGHLKLAQSLVAPVSLLGTAVAPGLIRRIGGESSPRRQVRLTLIGLCAALLVAACGSIACTLLVSFIGPHVTPAGAWRAVEVLILPCVVATTLVLVGQPGSALMRVRRYAGVAIGGQALGVLAGFALCILATRSDLTMFAWAMTLGSSITVLATYLLLFRRVRADGFSGGSDDRG